MDTALSQYKLPLSTSTPFPNYERCITCISWDKSGYRLLTGSVDQNMRYFDFSGMNINHYPFKEQIVNHQQSINSISQSSDGEYIFVSTEHSKPVFFTREGKFKIRCIAGDPYIFDNVKTCGHQNTVRQVCYNPIDNNKALSCSLDCTARIWDMNGQTSFDELISETAIRAKNRKGLKEPITACSYTYDSKLILLGTQDGSIQLFDSKNKFSRAQRTVFDAHSSEITSFGFDSSNTLLASRAKDNCVKIWDIRKLIKPIKVYNNIPTNHDSSNIAFGPKSGLFVVGTFKVPDSEQNGDMLFYDINNNNDTNPIYSYTVSDTASVVCVAWQSQFNQIVAGMSNGEMYGFYDKDYSTKGFLLTDQKQDTHIEEMTFGDENKAAWAVPDNMKMTQRNITKVHHDMVHSKSRINEPDKPANIDKGPNILVTLASQNFGTQSTNALAEDPREALLKREKEDDIQTKYLKNLFTKNDPNRILAKRTLEEDLDEQERILRKRQGRS